MLGSTERKVLNMSIQQTKKQSDLEKRLKLLRQQVSGKNEFQTQNFEFKTKGKTNIDSQAKISNTTSDIRYLHQDLIKITVLASTAFGFQIVLFFLIKNRVLNLNLF